MSRNYDLDLYGGAAPFEKDSETSKEAAEAIEPFASSMLWRVVAAMTVAGREGLTCDECEVALELRHQTASARVREAVLKGLIIDSGRTRPTRSGRKASVYVLVKR